MRYRFYKKITFLAFLLFLATGCTRLIKSNVVVFHILPDEPMPTKYAFKLSENQGLNLEYTTYMGLIRSELYQYQYNEVPLDKADVIVLFNYGVDSGSNKIRTDPLYGQTGIMSSTTFGTTNTEGDRQTYTESTIYTPSYGIVGAQTYTSTEYVRSFSLRIIDKASLKGEGINVLYEAKVVSEGRSNQLAEVIPAMIQAIFKEFPGKSGAVRREGIPLN